MTPPRPPTMAVDLTWMDLESTTFDPTTIQTPSVHMKAQLKAPLTPPTVVDKEDKSLLQLSSQ